jgi:septal ring factor EnvC (AmiA/AmiB activator)
MTMKDIKVSDELLAASELAREQQEAMQRTADQLIASLAEVRNELGALRAEVGAAKGVIPAIKTAADDAITTAGTRACAGMADTIARATSMATVPVVAKLDGAVRASGDLEGKLKRAAVWFSWPMAGKLALAFGGGLLVLFLLGWAVIAWRASEARDLATQIEERQKTLEQLEAKTWGVELFEDPTGRYVALTQHSCHQPQSRS